MQNATGHDTSTPSDNRDSNYSALVLELASLIDHVQVSLKLVEQAISGELPTGNQEAACNVIILDDVSPCYVRAGAAMKTCSLELGAVLRLLADTRTSDRPGESAADNYRAVRSSRYA